MNKVTFPELQCSLVMVLGMSCWFVTSLDARNAIKRSILKECSTCLKEFDQEILGRALRRTQGTGLIDGMKTKLNSSLLPSVCILRERR